MTISSARHAFSSVDCFSYNRHPRTTAEPLQAGQHPIVRYKTDQKTVSGTGSDSRSTSLQRSDHFHKADISHMCYATCAVTGIGPPQAYTGGRIGIGHSWLTPESADA